MLVLSRRLKEKVLFPGIDTAVQVLSVKGNVVRLGIEAPPEVIVLREELARQTSPAAAVEKPRDVGNPDAVRLAALAQQLRDRLKTTAVNLGMVQLLLDAGLADDAKEALARVREDFQLVRYGLDGELEGPPEKPKPARKALKALLVEDDQCQRELLASVLRMKGVEVDTAGDGCDALDHLRSRSRPDVVLLDMGLPGCDGATVVRTVRNDPAYAGLRIFAITGSSPDEFDLGTGQSGVDRWFQKPLDPASILDDLTADLTKSLCGV
jgi:two-component system, OmpR family, response regulator